MMTHSPRLASLQSGQLAKYFSLTFLLGSSGLTGDLSDWQGAGQHGSHTDAELFWNAPSNLYKWEAFK